MKHVHKYLLIMSTFSCANLSAISIVYNFRIAQVTKQPIFERANSKDHTLIALIFDQYQKKHTEIRQNFVGGFGSFIYNFGDNYFRIDFAVSHIHETTDHITTFSGTEVDDILFTIGRNFMLTPNAELTLSGLLGVPTHQILRLKHVDFGYSQASLGIQLDGSYAFTTISSLLYGTRYIHFFPRQAHDNLDQKYTFTIGNLADLLIANKNSWRKHGFELGYTARFQFGAHISPNLDDITEKTNYIRNNFYAIYKYKFLINTTSNRLLFNISYGFDSKPKIFGNKYIVTLWASWNINF